MSVRRLAPDAVQPASFAFTEANDNWADRQIAKYPPGRQASAVIPLLWKAQEQAGGWLPRVAIEAVAAKLGMAPMRVLEIATFYTMFNLQPVGTYFVQVCGTVPCHLRGARDIIATCQSKIGPQSTVTPDGKFSWLEVECLGACCNAPMVQINNDYYEDLTPENFTRLLDDLRAGRPVMVGSQIGRSASEPEGGGDTLKDEALYDGSAVGRGNWQARITEAREAAAKAAAAAEAAKAAEAAAPPAPPPAPAASPAPVTATSPPPVKPADAAPGRPPTAGPTNKVQDTPAAGGGAIAAKGAVPPAPTASPAPVTAASPPPVKPADAAPGRPPTAGPTGKAQDTPAAGGGAIGAEGAVPPAPAATAPPTEADKPALLAEARAGGPDDLELIWGVGAKLAAMLNRMGVFHFDQIAAWNERELAWVDAHLEGFRGRAVRDDWVGQAKKLAIGWRPEGRLGDRPDKA